MPVNLSLLPYVGSVTNSLIQQNNIDTRKYFCCLIPYNALMQVINTVAGKQIIGTGNQLIQLNKLPNGDIMCSHRTVWLQRSTF